MTKKEEGVKKKQQFYGEKGILQKSSHNKVVVIRFKDLDFQKLLYPLYFQKLAAQSVLSHEVSGYSLTTLTIEEVGRYLVQKCRLLSTVKPHPSSN